MTYLLLSIVISSLLYIVFKLFERFKVNNLHAIVVNYIVASSIGFISFKKDFEYINIPDKLWFPGALFLGFLFISVFNLMALTSQKNGISVASVASKMSIVIPVIVGVLLYKDQLGVIKIIGIIMAIIAVYLTATKNNHTIQKKNLVYPFILFLGSGIIDATLKYIQTKFVGDEETPLFSATIFFCAGSIGLFIVAYKSFFGKLKITTKSIIGGIALGIPNYFSIYYLLKALQNDSLNSATIFTINNVAIVMLTTLLGILLFKEKLIRKNWIGIIIAVLSIFLVASCSNKI